MFLSMFLLLILRLKKCVSYTGTVCNVNSSIIKDGVMILLTHFTGHPIKDLDVFVLPLFNHCLDERRSKN